MVGGGGGDGGVAVVSVKTVGHDEVVISAGNMKKIQIQARILTEVIKRSRGQTHTRNQRQKLHQTSPLADRSLAE